MTKDQAKQNLISAILRCWESGMTPDEVQDELDIEVDSYNEEQEEDRYGKQTKG